MTEFELKPKKIGFKRTFAIALAVCTMGATLWTSVPAVASTGNNDAIPSAEEASPGDPTAINLDQTSITLVKGEKATLTATIIPTDATDKSVAWKSSKEAIATVDDGVVTAVATGSTTITASTVNGKTATCDITVREAVASEENPTAITLDQKSLDLEEGDEGFLKASVEPASIKDPIVRWTSNNTSVATVKGDGTVKAVKKGQATITASTVNGKTAKCVVTVKEVETKKDPTGIALDQTSMTLKEGGKATLKATITPASVKDPTVKWETSDPKVATVANGEVTAVKSGKATIKATTVNNRTAECVVTVEPVAAPPVVTPPVVTPPVAPTIEVTGLTLDKTSVTLLKDAAVTLNAAVAPANATNKNIEWKTSDAGIATVANGVVTAVKSGKATITASTANGKTAECVVTVASVKLNASKTAIQKGKSSNGLAIEEKFPSSDKVSKWTTSNSKIVKVNAKSGKITGAAIGSANVTVTMASGATATCKVTVQKGKVVTKSVSISDKKVTLLAGKKITLTAKKNPVTAGESLKWSTSNKKIATVDSKGKVTAKKAGTATITVKSSNGKKATCKITVPGVTLKATSATVKKGKTTTIKVKSTVVKGDKATSFKSSNTKVATVTSKGVVKGVKKGTAKITVTMKSGAKTTFTIKVK